MFAEWQIKSRISDIFEPAENPIRNLTHAIQKTMNSNTILLKAESDRAILPDEMNSFFSLFIHNHFLNLFFDYDRISKNHDYYEWYTKNDSALRASQGLTGSLIKHEVFLKTRPISYLAFLEKLHWMLRTAPSFYSATHVTEEEAKKLIQDFVNCIFEDEGWDFATAPQLWQSIPKWIPHNWNFYDVVPDFLQNSGYWEHNNNAPDYAYFDGGSSDSCTFFYKEKVFYLLLTNGSP